METLQQNHSLLGQFTFEKGPVYVERAARIPPKEPFGSLDNLGGLNGGGVRGKDPAFPHLSLGFLIESNTLCSLLPLFSPQRARQKQGSLESRTSFEKTVGSWVITDWNGKVSPALS